MKTNIIILFLGIFLLCACEKNERLVYTSEASVFFKDFSTETDSLMVSLATKKAGTDTVFIKVNLLGQSLNTPTKFGLEIVEALTTAEENVHYMPLMESYLFPKDTFMFEVPVLLVKGDDLLKKQTVTLAVKLKADELETAYPDKQLVRIIYSDMFMPPVGNDNYGNMTYFVRLFGVYSQKKHQMIFEYLNEDLPTTRYAMYHKYYDPVWQACSEALSTYCSENTVIDENGNQILPWR
ncbi:DUF4843 domain-containing protein [Ancylomarina sp. DW003]|nr:DUF4843 domain-containing protein [Ancylomarina sp. DW003]MDE5422130.1 DUF4843 domain-containing protein [Ancylomarina sp. DW003]